TGWLRQLRERTNRSDALRREGVVNATLACFADALRRGDGRGRMFFQPISDAGGVAGRYECPGCMRASLTGSFSGPPYVAARAGDGSPSGVARLVCPFISQRISGVAMKVLTRAMITSIEKMSVGSSPRSLPMFKTISSISARVFMQTPIVSALR